MIHSHLPLMQQYGTRMITENTYFNWFQFLSCLIGKLPGRRAERGSRVDLHGFVISSSSDGATYVNPWQHRRTSYFFSIIYATSVHI